MIEREGALDELYNRLMVSHTTIGLQSFRRTPTSPIDGEKLPCVILHEGDDTIVKRGSRKAHGYPAARVLEVTLELVTSKDTDVKALLREVRRVIFTKLDGDVPSDPPVYDPVLVSKAFITETRTEGPTGYGLPDILGMSLVLELIYTDGGF